MYDLELQAPQKREIISIRLYPLRLFEVFYNYKPDRADKLCWREAGQVEDRKELYSLQLKWEISSGIQPMTVI